MNGKNLSKLRTLENTGKASNILLLFYVLPFIFIISCSTNKVKDNSQTAKWVGTWSTAQQLVKPNNMPPEPGLSNNTIRQIVRVSIRGDSLRMSFSNIFGSEPVTMKEVHIAASLGADSIDINTDVPLSFNGKPDATIEPGGEVMSDVFPFELKPLGNVAVTIYFGETSPDVTGHSASHTTSYIHPGNIVSSINIPDAIQTDHWYTIDRIDVRAPDSASAIAALGNSITDGSGSGTNKQNRWTDELSRRLQNNPGTKHVAVLNKGIGGNCVLKECRGYSALSRFDRDVIQQNGVKWLIVMEGINDIAQIQSIEEADTIANNLIAAYEQMIYKAHNAGIKVYGGTLLPFGGSSCDNPERQTAWEKVNDWIRNSGKFDDVIDFAEALKDPANPEQLLPAADAGDHIHPGEKGHQMIAEAVDLRLFE